MASASSGVTQTYEPKSHIDYCGKVFEHYKILAVYLAAIVTVTALLAACEWSAQTKIIVGCSAVGVGAVVGIVIWKRPTFHERMEKLILHFKVEDKLDKSFTDVIASDSEKKPIATVTRVTDFIENKIIYVIRVRQGQVVFFVVASERETSLYSSRPSIARLGDCDVIPIFQGQDPNYTLA